MVKEFEIRDGEKFYVEYDLVKNYSREEKLSDEEYNQKRVDLERDLEIVKADRQETSDRLNRIIENEKGIEEALSLFEAVDTSESFTSEDIIALAKLEKIETSHEETVK